MQVFITTKDFTYKGIAYPGLPLLVDDERPVEVVNLYLLHLIFERGKANSPATWRNHADALCDYFSWLEANSTKEKPLRWDDQPRQTRTGQEISNLSLYQHWSQYDYRKPDGYPLEYSTINQRTACVESFYRWAWNIARLITWLPYRVELKPVPQGHPGAFAHTHSQQYIESSDLRLKEKHKLPKLLNLEQCRELMAARMSHTLKRMCGLMLGTGLRNEECRTFPRMYIFDPTGLDSRKRIPIDCDPKDMKLKGDKPRRIYLSWQLMSELYEHCQYGEGPVRYQRFREREGHEPTLLFLNNDGQSWSDKGLNNALRKLWKGGRTNTRSMSPPVLTFRVTPHMLRHTFATLELYHEANVPSPKDKREIPPDQKRKRGMGHALAWVRDRLGHASIKSTTIYIHCIDMLDAHELNEYQRELDQMMTKEAHDA